MKFRDKLLRPIIALAFVLATMMPSFSATTSSSSSGYSAPSSRPSAPSTPMRVEPPRQPYTPPAVNNGYTKPPQAAVPPIAAPIPHPGPVTPPPVANSNSGFTKPGGAPSQPTGQTSLPPKQGLPPNALASAQTRNMSATSLTAYQSERANAKQPPMPLAPADTRNNPAYANASRAYGGNVDTYMANRQTSYSSYRTSNQSTFLIVHEIRPNYGIYDSGFLTGMIMGAVIGNVVANHNADMQRAAWLNAQQNQAWYPQYMADLRTQAETNAQLRERLAYMEGQQALARSQGVTVDATQLPQGVDPSIAIAPEAVITDSNFTQTPTGDRSPIVKSSHIWLWFILGLFGVVGLSWLVMRKR